MEKIVEINCLKHLYPDKTKVEICGIEFVVNKGEKVALLGPNGGGKTTLIKHILGILSPYEGIVSVFGLNPAKDFDKIRHRIGVVLQGVEEQLIGPTVIEDIMFSPINYGCNYNEAKEMAINIMKNLDIEHLKDKIIHYLSGGEKRKVALAGALVMNPDLLVLDEPFVGLDLKSQSELVNIINAITQEKQISVVVSTHDIELISEFADTMYLIASKQGISKKGTPKEIFALQDELKKYNLEEPAIVKLFNILKKDDINLGTPITIKEAAELIKDRLLYKG